MLECLKAARHWLQTMGGKTEAEKVLGTVCLQLIENLEITQVKYMKKRSTGHTHTHTPTENNTPDTHTHTRTTPHPPNEHSPQILNNTRR